MHLDSEEHETASEEEIRSGVGERLEFKSVGIDIGSSTTHLMFSRLVLVRRGRDYFSGYTVVEREVMYRSPVILTPLVHNNTRVDASRLQDFIHQMYADAHLVPAEIDTGAVVTTGEAAKKENTAAIIGLLAEDAGKFVCAAAGPNLEAVLAAHGSGAVKQSLQHRAGGHQTIFNVDIGGGTSKIAVVKEGRIMETGAMSVGSRLVAWDEEGILTRVEDAGQRVAASLGLNAVVGRRLGPEEREALAEKLSDLLFEALTQNPLSALAQSLMITPELTYRGPVDLVAYSGGVAEFIHGGEERSFGDLGPWIGASIRRRQQKWGIATGLADERIRATVIGASQYTVQVSGNTIFLSDPSVLPLHNLSVVKLPPFPDPLTGREVAASIRKGFQLRDLTEGEERAAIAVTWDQDPEYIRLREFAEGIIMALPRSLAGGLPIVLVFDNDVGKIIGHILSDRGVTPLLAIDNIDIGQLSYIDIGEQLSSVNAVPVTVKSLIFC